MQTMLVHAEMPVHAVTSECLFMQTNSHTHAMGGGPGQQPAVPTLVGILGHPLLQPSGPGKRGPET